MAAYAKLTAPRLAAAYARERLFARLDRGRECAGIWIGAPPGAGKTTLVASYAEARRLPCLWYQIDGGDADVASFFYYLGLAAKQLAPRAKKPLPLFTPEHAGGLAAFSRGWFRALFARLAAPCLLVLDNFQEAADAARLHEALSEGWQEVPAGFCVVVMSRGEPPPQVARRRANGGLECLGWDELRLDPDEARSLARSRSPDAGDEALRAVDCAEGWAAGVVLLLEAGGRTGGALPPQAPPQLVFDYFAAEVFSRLERTTQDFLMQTAFLPRLSVRMAEALTAHRDAQRVLDHLARHNQFTTHHGEYFQYHALFRAFLLARAAESFSLQRLAAIRRDGARLLDEAGMVEDALALWCEVQDWEAVAQATLRDAPTLLAQGRHALVTRWLGVLPPQRVAADPWLVYWGAAARLPFAPGPSRAAFQQAHESFAARGDRAGLFLSWAGAVQAVRFEMVDASPLDGLIARLEALLREDDSFPSEAIEYQVAHGMYNALFWRRPQHPDFARWKQRALALAREGPDRMRRAYTVYMGVLYELFTGHRAEAELLLDSMAALRMGDLPPVVQSLAYLAHAYLQRESGLPQDCLETVRQGLQAAAASGVHVWNPHLAGNGVLAAIAIGDIACADGLLAQVAASAHARGGGIASWYHFLAAACELMRGDARAALPHAEAAVRLGGGWLFFESLAHFSLAAALSRLGQAEAAKEQLRRMRAIACTMQSDYLLHLAHMTQADLSIQEGDRAAALTALGEGLSLGRRHEYLGRPWRMVWQPAELARLCALALEHGIETEYVRRIIRLNRVTAPSPQAKDWPWPLRIHTLGRFAVLVDDETLSFPAKAQKKPLELLKALVAHGGRSVGAALLIEQLWPDLEGDAGHNALDLALHRLRKLLRHGELVVVQEGKLTLDAQQVWTDVWAFEEFGGELECGLRQGRDDAWLIAAGDDLLERYPGHFLAEEEAGWALSARERLRSRFLRAVSAIGRALERIGAWEQTAALYRRAIELDPLTEEFHRGLMHSYHAQGRQAEALDAYRHCRDLLSLVLGVEPSSATQAVYRALKA